VSNWQCIPRQVGDTFLPCNRTHTERGDSVPFPLYAYTKVESCNPICIGIHVFSKCVLCDFVYFSGMDVHLL
jgi:hypothetical protein